MSAIITSQFRLRNANNFISLVKKSAIDATAEKFFVFIGKSDAWSLNKDDNSDTVPDQPKDTLVTARDAWQNMIALKKVTECINLAPRHNWIAGDTSVVAWDDNMIDQEGEIYQKKYYVMTDEFKVYKCIVAGSSGTTSKPTHTSTEPFAGADGYLWKYMFTVSLSDGSKFLTNYYIPVKTVVEPVENSNDGPLNDDDEIKLDNQEANKTLAGKIYKYKVTNGGTGYGNKVGSAYTTTPVVTIYGNGTNATAVATLGAIGSLNEGKIISVVPSQTTRTVTFTASSELVTLTNHGFSNGNEIVFTSVPSASGLSTSRTYYVIEKTSSTFKLSETYNRETGASAVINITADGSGTFITVGSGADYSVAFTEITGGGGSGAVVEPILSPNNGHGTDPVSELGAFFAGVYTTLENTEADAVKDFIVEGSFRQIGLIQNPTLASNATADQRTYSALQQLQIDTVTAGATTGVIQIGDYITQSTNLVNGFPVPLSSDAVAFVDDIDLDANPPYIKYHQNDKTGYAPFLANGVSVRGKTGGVTKILTTGVPSGTGLRPAEVVKFTGEILFIENRRVINRTLSQVEDIKIVIEF